MNAVNTSMNSKKKKICFVLPAHWETYMGGAQYQAKFIVEALVASGRYEVHYVSRRTAAEAQDGSHHLHHVQGPRWLARYSDTFDAVSLWRTLKSIQPDLIYHRTGTGHTGICAAYARHHKVPLLWHVASEVEVIPTPDLNVWRYPHKALEKLVLEYGLRRVDKTIVQTQTQLELLQQHYGRPSDLVIPNFHPEPAEVVSKSQPLQVVWIANVKAGKQPDVFVELAAQLRHMTGVEFTMMGSPPDAPEERARFMQRVAQLPNLTYLGKVPQEEVNQLLAHAHLLVNTSHYEGLSNTFIQAWMREVPVVSLNTNPDGLLSNDRLGSCAGGSVDLLRELVTRFLCDDEMRLALGRDAREFALDQFSMRNVDRLVALIDDTLASESTCPG